MSEEQLAAFWEAVEADASLQEKLSASTDGDIDTPIEVDAVIAIAKDAGFTITAGDLLRADAPAILELNDDELEKVSGGISFQKFIKWFTWDSGAVFPKPIAAAVKAYDAWQSDPQKRVIQ